MAAINGQQIKKIYAIGNALGIVERGNEEDALHSLVAAVTGKASVRALTSTEAQAVIGELQQRQGTPPPRRKPKTHTERPGGATAAQQRKVWALLYELQKSGHSAQQGHFRAKTVRHPQKRAAHRRPAKGAFCLDRL